MRELLVSVVMFLILIRVWMTCKGVSALIKTHQMNDMLKIVHFIACKFCLKKEKK